MFWIRKIPPNRELNQLFRKAFIVTLGGNCILAIAKSYAALVSGSTAIYADAVNSISDVVYSILLIIGLRLSQRPPDATHPQGHSRFEPFVGLMITVSMSLAGFEALRASYMRFKEGGGFIVLDCAIIILVFSAVIKGLMYLQIKNFAKKTISPGLDATALDNLSDVLTSLAAFVGIIGTNFIHPLFDPLAGFVVAFWIFRSAFLSAKENFGFLTGAAADNETHEKILQIAKQVEGVDEVHSIISEYSGPKLVIDMHINVDGEISLNQAHAICDTVTKKLEALPEIDRVYVHVEPIGFR